MTARRSLLALASLGLPPLGGAGRARASDAAVEARPQGGWRVMFRPGDPGLPAGAGPALAEIGRRLAERPAGMGRITVEGRASGPPGDVSAARRLSLARAVAVRQALAAGGLATTRVDVRALGAEAGALDAADILPPEAPRSGRR